MVHTKNRSLVNNENLIRVISKQTHFLIGMTYIIQSPDIF